MCLTLTHIYNLDIQYANENLTKRLPLNSNKNCYTIWLISLSYCLIIYYSISPAKETRILIFKAFTIVEFYYCCVIVTSYFLMIILINKIDEKMYHCDCRIIYFKTNHCDCRIIYFYFINLEAYPPPYFARVMSGNFCQFIKLAPYLPCMSTERKKNYNYVSLCNYE